MVSTTSGGCLPVAVSALSITASAPSSTALATSVISLRLGFTLSIILSIICVATITGLPRWIHLRMMSLCAAGTFSTGSSTPRSPRATIMPSDSNIILRRSTSADGISIFAITLVTQFFSASLLFRSMISSALRTNDNATQSSSCSIINARSIISFSVIAGSDILVSGRLTPFLGNSVPP